MSPLELAMLLAKVGDTVRRDEKTGLFIIDGTEPPTEVRLVEYEAAKKILAFREVASSRK